VNGFLNVLAGFSSSFVGVCLSFSSLFCSVSLGFAYFFSGFLLGFVYILRATGNEYGASENREQQCYFHHEDNLQLVFRVFYVGVAGATYYYSKMLLFFLLPGQFGKNVFQ